MNEKNKTIIKEAIITWSLVCLTILLGIFFVPEIKKEYDLTITIAEIIASLVAVYYGAKLGWSIGKNGW